MEGYSSAGIPRDFVVNLVGLSVLFRQRLRRGFRLSLELPPARESLSRASSSTLSPFSADPSTKLTIKFGGSLLSPVRETSSSILSSIPLSGIGLSVLFRRYPVDPLSTKLTTKFGGLLVGRNSSGLRRQSRWAGSFFSFPSIQPRLTHLPRGEDPGVLRFHPETPHLRAHLFADFLKCRIVNEIR